MKKTEICLIYLFFSYVTRLQRFLLMQRRRSSCQTLHKSTKGQNALKVKVEFGAKDAAVDSVLRFNSILSVCFSSGLISIICSPDDEQSMCVQRSLSRYSESPQTIIQANQTEITLQRLKVSRAIKTFTWNDASGGWNMTRFTIHRVHPINFSVTLNVIQLNILSCDFPEKTNEGVWY